MNRIESSMEELETSTRRWESKAKKLELKVSKLESKVEKHKTREHYLLRALLGTWVFVLLYCLCCYLKTIIKSDHMLAIKGWLMLLGDCENIRVVKLSGCSFWW